MKKIYLAHNTCLNSSYDLNVLRAGLYQGGFEIVSRPEDADEIIYSGCSVRSRWVDDAITQIDEAGIHVHRVCLTSTTKGLRLHRRLSAYPVLNHFSGLTIRRPVNMHCAVEKFHAVLCFNLLF